MSNDFEKAKTSLVTSTDDCIDTWCTKKGVHKTSLLEWKTIVIIQLHNKIVELENKSVYHEASTNSLRKHKNERH